MSQHRASTGISHAQKRHENARIGVDIGGTFTDVVLEVEDNRYTAKVMTTADEPAVACMDGIENVLNQANLTPDAVHLIIHGTTLATNAIIERKGSTTSLVTTAGFRDTLQMGTEGRPEQYDINIIQPLPLVPRSRRFTVDERLNSRGEVLIPLREESLATLLPSLDAVATESLAIAFLHSYINPCHEQFARDYFATQRPDWLITISAETSPEFREFERFSTACANAYIRPIMERYLRHFEARLKERGFRCPLLLMLSSGGLTTVDIATAFPVRLVESGPSGGAIFAADIAVQHNIRKAISFDLGGTTAKICMIDDGRVQSSRKFEVAREYRFRKDSGIPLRIPVVEMVEIGAGGGSIAWLDALNRITIGPKSAGSLPGPACYDRGGVLATVTDANVVLGRIDPDEFAGGEMKLDANKAIVALDAELGSHLSLSPMATAFGVTEMVCENMASAARVHAIESGKNVADRTLIAFGGAAPLHACQLAEKLGIRRIIIPNNAGVGAAVGFLRAPISYEVVRTLYQKVDNFNAELVNTAFRAMEKEATHYVQLGAGTHEELFIQRQAYMRYQGQGHEIAIDLRAQDFTEDGGGMLQNMFDAGYRNIFGRDMGGIAAAEAVAWSVTVSTRTYPDIKRQKGAHARQHKSPIRRSVFDPPTQSLVDYKIYARNSLAPGSTIQGAAIIVEDETSTVIDSRFVATILPSGDIEITRQNTA